MIVLDGTSLTCAEVAAIGRRVAGVEIGESGQDRASLGAQVSRAVSAGRDIYGRSSGVGANRSLRVDDADGEAQDASRVHWRADQSLERFAARILEQQRRSTAFAA